MEEEDTKQCPNCKREIPSINFTTHSVHCARNLRNCPVCKEPVPLAQLQEHHDALHKEVPCKKCGESVCGTDLEDHIRDSCAQTIKPCRYCELELPRHALPPHETYCGARSEQCAECREYVLLKYRQLHLDSNHGFTRLSDDPIPIQVKAKQKPITNGFGNPSTSSQNGTRDLRASIPQTEIRYYSPGSNNQENASSNVDRNGAAGNSVGLRNIEGVGGSLGIDNRVSAASSMDNRVSAASGIDNRVSAASSMDNRVSAASGIDNRVSAASSMDNRVSAASSMDNRVSATSSMDNRVERNGKAPVKRMNDQPQINTSVEPREKVHKELPSRGAVKKRPAPRPPAPPAPPADERRDLPYWSAQKRAQDEERKRQEQTAYNLSVGLPPVLSPAAKLDKLRKMDALHNREVEEDYSHKLRGRVWRPAEPGGHRLGSQGQGVDDLSHLRPMTAQQFMNRFQELQLSADRRANGATSPGARGAAVLPGGAAVPPGGAAVPPGGARAPPRTAGGDRFSEIKSSLRELRRGLNEVTAPYNSASNSTKSNNVDSNRLSPPSPPPEPNDADGELRLPCEFCGVPILADDLVLHQTGCRPDLTQYRPKKSSRPRSPRPPRPRTASEMDDPVIPCEFCTESLPVYLISEHQERCRRDANVLYPD